VLWIGAGLCVAGDLVTTAIAQLQGHGEATAWLAHVFNTYGLATGLLALAAGKGAYLLATGSMLRVPLLATAGYGALLAFVVTGGYVVVHNVAVYL
jgi:hypothetical protein